MLDGGQLLELQSSETLPVRSRPLKKVAKLQFDGQGWLLDGKDAKACCVTAQMRRRAGREGRTAEQTMLELKRNLDAVPFEDRWKIVGVAWFGGRAGRVDGETAEDCAERKEFLTNRGGCEEIKPLDPADRFMPVFLTDCGIISHQSAATGLHTMAYETIIEGQKQTVHGFGEHGGMVLANGQRCTFERLPGGSKLDIFAWKLLEVVRLESLGDDLKWNGEESLVQWLAVEQKKAGAPMKALEDPEFFKRCRTMSEFRKLENKDTVRAVAWFDYDDGAGGLATPIFLGSFRLLADDVAHVPKATKRIARFENDYSIAMIPQEHGSETPMAIEPELRTLIKTIMEAGGNVPRTTLRNGKSDPYQPEKLLLSKVAKALIRNNLLGTTKSGRTTVFWAKQSA
jgi:hypothetical protein